LTTFVSSSLSQFLGKIKGKQASKAKAKEMRRVQGEDWNNIYTRNILAVTGCMYDFLVVIRVHGTCIWFTCHFAAIGIEFTWISNSSTLPFHFLESHGVMRFILD